MLLSQPPDSALGDILYRVALMVVQVWYIQLGNRLSGMF